MLIASVDPGLSGALAFVDTSTGVAVDVIDMPTHELRRGGKVKRELDARGLAAALGRDRIGHCFIEQVNSMPGQGVSSVFSFGKSFGITIGVLAALGVPYTLVAPVAAWKRALGVPASKDAARYRASQLMPGAIALYGVRHLGRAVAA